MKPVRLLTLGAGSVALALAAGSLYQPDAPPRPAEPSIALADPAADEAPVTSIAAAPPVADAPPQAMPDPDPEAGSARADLGGWLDGSRLARLLRGDPLPADAAPGCVPALDLTAQPGAMIGLSLAAPCQAGQTVTLAHGALQLDLSLDPSGRLELTLPALAPLAEVRLTLADGRSLTETVALDDFAGVRRLLIAWEGPLALDLVAPAGFEFDLHLTGSDGAQARVLGLGAGIDWIEGELAIEAQSCDQSFAALVHLIRDDGPIARRELYLDLPGCEQDGGFVLIPDILPEGWADTVPPGPEARAAAARADGAPPQADPTAIHLAKAD